MRRLPLAALLLLGTAWSLPALATAQDAVCVTNLRADVHHTRAEVNMSWDPVEGAQFYDVYRSIDGGNLTFLIRVEAGFPSLGDEGTYGNLTYAIAVDGNLDPSCPTVSVTVAPRPVDTSHCAPSLTAVAGETDVRLGWDQVPGVTYYYVWRIANEGGFDMRGRVDAGTFEFTDTIEGGITYRYVVVGNAFDPTVCPAAIVSAIPFFPGWLGVALGTLGAVGVFVVMRRRG